MGAKDVSPRRQVCGRPKGCVDGSVFLLEGKIILGAQGPFEQLGLRIREVDRVV